MCADPSVAAALVSAVAPRAASCVASAARISDLGTSALAGLRERRPPGSDTPAALPTSGADHDELAASEIPWLGREPIPTCSGRAGMFDGISKYSNSPSRWPAP